MRFVFVFRFGVFQAARNVLLGSGMVCKVADFGLSRRVQTEDNTGDYYRSTSGIIPVHLQRPFVVCNGETVTILRTRPQSQALDPNVNRSGTVDGA